MVITSPMESPIPSSSTPSRISTPNSLPATRFTSQSSTAEDLLKSQTVGLVHLSDFRKRRAEALEQKEREAHHQHRHKNHRGLNYSRFTSASTAASGAGDFLSDG